MSFLFAPEDSTDERGWLRQMAKVVNGVMRGHTNNTGTLTLDSGATSTTITFASGLIGNDTVIILIPTTANAATEFGAGSLYVSSRSVTNNTITITHANTAQNDKTFYYVLVG